MKCSHTLSLTYALVLVIYFFSCERWPSFFSVLVVVSYVVSYIFSIVRFWQCIDVLKKYWEGENVFFLVGYYSSLL